MNRQDLTGKKFGKLTVDEMLYNYNGTQTTKCLCHCDCGKSGIIRSAYLLKKARDSSCGCGKKEYIRKHHGRDINGERFGRLVVMDTLWEEDPPKVKCKCDCGNIKILAKKDVQNGHTRSCGCLSSELISKLNTVDHTNDVSDYGIKILSPSGRNNKGQLLWACQCGFCGKIFNELPSRVLNNHIKSCGCINKSSREIFIENLLKKLNVDYKAQYSFNDCKNDNGYALRFDFAILQGGRVFYLIEYDGEQHFKPVYVFGGETGYINTKKRDKIKNEYCEKNSINLLRLPYTLTEREIEEKITNVIYP